jgi:hypothetical protein
MEISRKIVLTPITTTITITKFAYTIIKQKTKDVYDIILNAKKYWSSKYI